MGNKKLIKLNNALGKNCYSCKSLSTLIIGILISSLYSCFHFSKALQVQCSPQLALTHDRRTLFRAGTSSRPDRDTHGAAATSRDCSCAHEVSGCKGWLSPVGLTTRPGKRRLACGPWFTAFGCRCLFLVPLTRRATGSRIAFVYNRGGRP